MSSPKKGIINDNGGQKLTCINLWRNPATAFDALAIYHGLKNNPLPSEFPNGQGSLELVLEKEKIAEVLTYSWEEFRGWPSWLSLMRLCPI